MKQSTIQTFQTFVKPPLPKGYSPSHILTYRKCEYKFLLAFVYKAKVETKYKPLLEGSTAHELISNGIFISDDTIAQDYLSVAKDFLTEMPENPIFETVFADKNNPGTFKGSIFETPFMATFDVHWIEGIGIDWNQN